MKNWFSKNLKNIIIGAFVVPILLVAFVSISHVTSFYGISNPLSWAIYLSVGIEIAALSALAAVSVNMGRFVYLPFFVVTLIQMLGNIFFSFTFIDENSQTFQDWIAMVGGLFENMGVDKTDLNTHKTILSFLTGGLLPIISLTFAHMLVKFSENQKNELIEKNEETETIEKPVIVDLPELIAKKQEEDENLKYTPTKEDLEKLENILKRYEGPEEKVNETPPVVLSDDKLKELENILSKYQNKTDEDVDVNNIENSNEDQNIEESTNSELINDTVLEPTVENLEVINITPQEIEDKKKISDETQNGSDYKVLNYTKNV